MDNNSTVFADLFKQVAAKGWIKGVGQSWGNIGLTFEHEIGKSPDSKYKPDFGDIEIKCSTRYSHYPIFLFTLAFDSNENEVIRLANEYGHCDSDYPDRKVIFKKVTNSIVPGNKYNFFFEIDKQNEKIYLAVYSADGELLEKEAYITFANLKKHIETKLNKVAYINASMKKIDENKYYRYYALQLFKLRGFEKFLDLIAQNVIIITIISRISKSGDDKGRYRNKNIEFAIRKDCLDKLFESYYQYNHDFMQYLI